MTRRGPRYLDEEMLNKLRKYCKGCQYFKPDKPTKDICTIVGWYDILNMQDIKRYVEYCPCNKKCLVKAACTEVTCPLWLDYVKDVVREKSYKFIAEGG